jgi:hypothetical protein
MRRFGWAGVVVVLGAWTAPAAGRVTLAWKLNEGDRFYLEEKTTAAQNLTFMGRDVKQGLEQTRVTRFTVLKRKPDNSLVLEEKIETVRAKLTGKVPITAKLLRDLEGATFRITLNPQLRVTRFEGYETLMKKLGKEEEVGKVLRALIPKEGLSQQVEALFRFLPDKPVRQGARWTFTAVRPLGFLGSLQTTNRCTREPDERVEGGQAVRLAVAVTRAVFEPAGAGGELPFRVVKGNVKLDKDKTGETVWFSARRGRIIKSRRRTVLGGSVTVDAMGAMLTIDVEHEETVAARVLDKNPLK